MLKAIHAQEDAQAAREEAFALGWVDLLFRRWPHGH